MLGIFPLIQVDFIAFCIVSDIVHRGWVDILIIGDVNKGSAFDARGAGGKILEGLED